MPKVERTCECGCGVVLTGRQKRWASPICSKSGERDVRLMKIYGITAAEYDLMLAYQEGKCGICERPPKPGEVFHVDHAHVKGPAGPVRGLLCPYCNTRLVGRLKDAEKAKKMWLYLSDPPATKALGREQWAEGRPKKTRRRTTRRRTK